MKKRNFITIILMIFLLLVLIIYFFYSQQGVPINQQPMQEAVSAPLDNNINITKETVLLPEKNSLRLVVDNITIELRFHSGASFLDVLSRAKENKQISFEGKTFSGLGFFVTSIGSLKSGNGKNLMYYINGKEASVGISTYIPTNGDVIEWKLK